MQRERVIRKVRKYWWIIALIAVGALSGIIYGIVVGTRSNATTGTYRNLISDIQMLIVSNSRYDDGSYGPLFLRLAWHSSGTYDRTDKTGGSNGATMRFPPESTDPENKGLDIARNLLETIKQKYSFISYADLWTLAAVVAIRQMGGPKIPWRFGRTDRNDKIPENGRLPIGSKTQDHIRQVFYRIGFNDYEIVALMGGHTVGRCHPERSNYTGPWVFTPTKFSNNYYEMLVNNNWTIKIWPGLEQFEDQSKRLMMLPVDMSLLNDPVFSEHVKTFARNQSAFFEAFASAFEKVLEFGVDFPADSERINIP
jgi:catalase (peroxidase I)